MISTVLNRILSLLFIAYLCAFMACEDKVNETPSLGFSQPKNGAIIWNTFTLDLRATAELGDSEIDLFLGDSLIGTISKPPYTFDFNTKSIPDGDYELRAVSSDTQLKAEVKISIRNSLLVMKVDSDHLPAGVRGFLFLSDKDGKALASREFKNGDQVNISTDYPYTNFTLSEAYVNGTQAISVYSFQEIPRGHWTLLENNEFPAVINNIGLDFTDISSAYYFISSSGDAEFLYSKSSMDLRVSKTPTKLFIREYNNPINHFKIVNNLDPTNRQTISLSGIIEPLAIENVTLSGAMNKRGSVKLFGFTTQNNFQEYYNLGTFFSKNGVIKIEYPANGFPIYGSTSFYKDDVLTINSFQFNKKSDLLPMNAEVNFKGLPGLSASVSTFGDIDIYTAAWAYFNEKSNSAAYWAMVGPTGRSQTIRLPDVPREVILAASNVNFNELQFSNTLEVSNFEIATDYSSYTNYISKKSLAGPYAFGNSWKEQVFTKSGSTHGKTNQQSFQSLSERLQSK